MHVLVTCKNKKDWIKNNREKVDIVFPIISQWELSVAMETRVLIFKFESVDDGRRRTDNGPLVYYKLTLWNFGSGELNIN